MDIIKAGLKDLETVKQITEDTIREIYPKYYPEGAVDFFLLHHNTENIRKDINSDCVFLIYSNGSAAGTVTVKDNHILRLFVFPQFQKQGLGRRLLDFAEAEIAKYYDETDIDASLPAKSIYLKRGYTETAYRIIETENGDYLCYDEMKKKLR